MSFVMTDQFSMRVKKYFTDWYLMDSEPTLTFKANFNSINYGHIIKRM